MKRSLVRVQAIVFNQRVQEFKILFSRRGQEFDSRCSKLFSSFFEFLLWSEEYPKLKFSSFTVLRRVRRGWLSSLLWRQVFEGSDFLAHPIGSFGSSGLQAVSRKSAVVQSVERSEVLSSSPGWFKFFFKAQRVPQVKNYMYYCGSQCTSSFRSRTSNPEVPGDTSQRHCIDWS